MSLSMGVISCTCSNSPLRLLPGRRPATSRVLTSSTINDRVAGFPISIWLRFKDWSLIHSWISFGSLWEARVRSSQCSLCNWLALIIVLLLSFDCFIWCDIQKPSFLLLASIIDAVAVMLEKNGKEIQEAFSRAEREAGEIQHFFSRLVPLLKMVRWNQDAGHAPQLLCAWRSCSKWKEWKWKTKMAGTSDNDWRMVGCLGPEDTSNEWKEMLDGSSAEISFLDGSSVTGPNDEQKQGCWLFDLWFVSTRLFLENGLGASTFYCGQALCRTSACLHWELRLLFFLLECLLVSFFSLIICLHFGLFCCGCLGEILTTQAQFLSGALCSTNNNKLLAHFYTWVCIRITNHQAALSATNACPSDKR